MNEQEPFWLNAVAAAGTILLMLFSLAFTGFWLLVIYLGFREIFG